MSTSNKSASATPAKKAAPKAATKKTAGSATPAAEKTAKPTPTETPKVESAPAKQATRTRKKVEKPAAEATVAEAETTGGSGSSEPAANNDVSTTSVDKMIDAFLERKRAESKSLKDDLKMLRELKAAWNRQVRQFKTNNKKRREVNRGGANRSPSGFAQPTRVKDALCDFLGIDRGSSVARTDVTRQVIKYITDHNLKEAGNGRNIIPDETLERLVGGAEERYRTMEERKAFLKDMSERYPNKEEWKEKYEKCVVTDQLTYFNLQVHLSKHFYKNEKKRAADESAPVATVTA